MRKIKEVLRLKFEVGLGLRQIARSCSIGLGTAQRSPDGSVTAGSYRELCQLATLRDGDN